MSGGHNFDLPAATPSASGLCSARARRGRPGTRRRDRAGLTGLRGRGPRRARLGRAWPGCSGRARLRRGGPGCSGRARLGRGGPRGSGRAGLRRGRRRRLGGPARRRGPGPGGGAASRSRPWPSRATAGRGGRAGPGGGTAGRSRSWPWRAWPGRGLARRAGWAVPPADAEAGLDAAGAAALGSARRMKVGCAASGAWSAAGLALAVRAAAGRLAVAVAAVRAAAVAPTRSSSAPLAEAGAAALALARSGPRTVLVSAFLRCGPITMIMFRPSCFGADSTKPSSSTSPASRCSSLYPSSGRDCSRPRNMIVTLTLSPCRRNRSTWPFLVP